MATQVGDRGRYVFLFLFGYFNSLDSPKAGVVGRWSVAATTSTLESPVVYSDPLWSGRGGHAKKLCTGVHRMFAHAALPSTPYNASWPGGRNSEALVLACWGT